MKAVALGDLIAPARVRKAGSSTFPILSMTMHDGLVDQTTKFKKRVASEDISSYKVIERGQLVVGFPIDEGVLDFQSMYERAIVSPAYGVWDLVADRVVDRDYLQRYLRSPMALAYYRAKLRGSTARRRSLPSDVFLALPVPLFPLEEQCRTTAILDQADALRGKRRRALSYLDNLLQSLLLEVMRDENARERKLGEVAELFAGGTLPAGETYTGQGGGHLLMKVSDMNRPGNEQMIVDCALWSPNAGSRSATCPAGSIVIPKRGGAIGTNKKRITTRPTVLDPNLMAIVPSPELDLQYLFAWFLRFDLTRLSSGSSVPQLNKQDLYPLALPMPPWERQCEFARAAQSVESLAFRYRKQLSASDELFEGLQARAFAGGL